MALQPPRRAQAARRASIPYQLQQVTAVLGRLARNARAAQAVTCQTALEQLTQEFIGPLSTVRSDTAGLRGSCDCKINQQASTFVLDECKM